MGRDGLLFAHASSQKAKAMGDEEASPITKLGQVEFPGDGFPSLHYKPGAEEHHQQVANQFARLLSEGLFIIHSINSFLLSWSVLIIAQGLRFVNPLRKLFTCDCN